MRTPKAKKYNYCGPGTKLKESLDFSDPKYSNPINNLDEICQKHDTDYSLASSLSDEHKADDLMLDRISKIPYKDRPWATSLVQAIIAVKENLVLVFQKKGHSRRLKKKTGKKN